jgi:hypothetical protein
LAFSFLFLVELRFEKIYLILTGDRSWILMLLRFVAYPYDWRKCWTLAKSYRENGAFPLFQVLRFSEFYFCLSWWKSPWIADSETVIEAYVPSSIMPPPHGGIREKIPHPLSPFTVTSPAVSFFN